MLAFQPGSKEKKASMRCMQVVYDMQKAWDDRSRKFYGTRYDYRRNAVG